MYNHRITTWGSLRFDGHSQEFALKSLKARQKQTQCEDFAVHRQCATSEKVQKGKKPSFAIDVAQGAVTLSEGKKGGMAAPWLCPVTQLGVLP
jgi:hypothetical protein